MDGGRPADWPALLATGRYRLLLATDATTRAWLDARPDVRILAGDADLAFFEATGG